MKFKDYYQTMGLKPEAKPEEIKRAYRKLARKYHPDVSHEADAEAKFKELGEAYEVLKDPVKKQQYDQLRKQGWHAGESFGAAHQDHFYQSKDENVSPFSDFFDFIFGQGANKGYSPGFKTRKARGEDVYYLLEVDPQESYHGASRQIQIPILAQDQEGNFSQSTRTVNIKIPKGVTEGQQIRLRGLGHAGVGEAGDLYLEIKLKQKPPFQLEGKNVNLILPVTPWEAALGAKLKVPTLGGLIDVKIPPNSQNGTKLRLKGRGLPGDPAGDQFITLQMKLPPATSQVAQALYQQMAKEINFNPRESLGV